MQIPKRRLSRISALHYAKLVFRSVLFLLSAAAYVVDRVRGTLDPFGSLGDRPAILAVVWIVFACEMVLRFFPSRFESMGCQKQFAVNFKPVAQPVRHQTEAQRRQPHSTVQVITVWLALNAVIGALYFLHVIDEGILLLIALAYSICDMICILFFCPFQTWFMKNKCCGSCRIYNWDYAMMFTPLVLIKSFYTWSLVALSLGLLAEWELLYRRHPERFSETTNRSLSCVECKEKLCHHKKSLQKFLAKQTNRLLPYLHHEKDPERTAE